MAWMIFSMVIGLPWVILAFLVPSLIFKSGWIFYPMALAFLGVMGWRSGFVSRTGVKYWPPIKTRERVKWSLIAFFKYFIASLSTTLLPLLTVFYCCFLVGGLAYGVREGIYLNLYIIPYNVVFFDTIGGLAIGFVAALFLFGFQFWVGVVEALQMILTNESTTINKTSKPYERFLASIGHLYFAIFQYWHLMHLFNKGKLLPRCLVTFLREMTARHILTREGGSWRFRHRILQEYFAERLVKPVAEEAEKS
jgi:hypothetical protein